MTRLKFYNFGFFHEKRHKHGQIFQGRNQSRERENYLQRWYKDCRCFTRFGPMVWLICFLILSSKGKGTIPNMSAKPSHNNL